jgi:F420H2 dehydrogenase subunit J
MSEKSGVSVVGSIFELVALLLALAVIFGGLAVVLFLSPWSQTVIQKIFDISFLIELGSYLVIAAIVVLLSALVVYSNNMVHSALYLLGSFAGVAALYILLNATFLGVAQVLVYIGAVGVLILFAVMLTRKTIVEESHGEL